MNLYEDIIKKEERLRNRSMSKRADLLVNNILTNYDLDLARKRERLYRLLKKEEDEYMNEILDFNKALDDAKREDFSRNRSEFKVGSDDSHECYIPYKRYEPPIFDREKEIELNTMREMQICEKLFSRELERNDEKFWHALLIDQLKKEEESQRLKDFERKMKMTKLRENYDAHIERAERLRKDIKERERAFERERHAIILKNLQDEYWIDLQRKRNAHQETSQYLKETIENTSAQNSQDCLREKAEERYRNDMYLNEIKKDLANKQEKKNMQRIESEREIREKRREEWSLGAIERQIEDLYLHET